MTVPTPGDLAAPKERAAVLRVRGSDTHHLARQGAVGHPSADQIRAAPSHHSCRSDGNRDGRLLGRLCPLGDDVALADRPGTLRRGALRAQLSGARPCFRVSQPLVRGGHRVLPCRARRLARHPGPGRSTLAGEFAAHSSGQRISAGDPVPVVSFLVFATIRVPAVGVRRTVSPIGRLLPRGRGVPGASLYDLAVMVVLPWPRSGLCRPVLASRDAVGLAPVHGCHLDSLRVADPQWRQRTVPGEG